MNLVLRFSVIILLFITGKIMAQQIDPNAPVMKFDTTGYDFGTAQQHTQTEYSFKFQNTGKSPLIISNASTPCGCAVASYPKEPILPGKTGEVKMLLDMNSMLGSVDKTAYIYSNNRDGEIVLHIKGRIVSKSGDPLIGAAIMVFDSLVKNAGRTEQGTLIRKNYFFTNEGSEPLIIYSIKTSDGGGGWNYRGNDTIMPGEMGCIEIYQSTEARIGIIDKSTTIESNNHDGIIVLHLKAEVVLCYDPNPPVMKFDSDTFNFGTVKQGELVRYEFHFTNTGKMPLIIQNATTQTGAAVVEWPKEPIPPGKTGVIKYTFNTVGKMGPQNKAVIVWANTCPQEIHLKVRGKVEPAAAQNNSGCDIPARKN